jgi:hypothetical protein
MEKRRRIVWLTLQEKVAYECDPAFVAKMLPEGAVVVSEKPYWHAERCLFGLHVEHPSFAVVPEGALIPTHREPFVDTVPPRKA